MFFRPMTGSQYFSEPVSLSCDLLWYNKKNVWSLSMVLSKDFLKPLGFPSDKGDGSILCSDEATAQGP